VFSANKLKDKTYFTGSEQSIPVLWQCFNFYKKNKEVMLSIKTILYKTHYKGSL